MRTWMRVAAIATLALSTADRSAAQQPADAVTVAPSGFERVGSGPENFFWIRNGLSGLVDTLANSIALVDDAGRIVGRVALPDGFAVSAIEAGDDRIVLLSGDKAAAIELPRTINPAAPPTLSVQSLTVSRRDAAPGVARQSKTQLTILPGRSGRTTTGALDVRSLTGRPLADVTDLGSDRAGLRYVLWSEFVSANPQIVVRAFVGRYGADGKLTGVAEVPLADMDYVPEGYATVTGEGQLRVMVPTKSGLEIRTILIQAIAAASPRTTRNLVQPNVLRDLGAQKGPVTPVPSSVVAPSDDPNAQGDEPGVMRQRAARPPEPISRAKVLELARAFLTQSWTLTDKNFAHGTPQNLCDKENRQYWRRPGYLKKEMVGQELTRIPYRWGGFDSPTSFADRMKKGQLAGDVCTCRDESHNHCLVHESAGVDCSGFVSRAWGLRDKEGTSTLAGVSTTIKGWDVTKLRAGDALNRANNHVRLVVEVVSAPQVRIMVIESTAAKDCKRADDTRTTCEGVCECARPITDFNGYQLLRFKGIRD